MDLECFLVLSVQYFASYNEYLFGAQKVTFLKICQEATDAKLAFDIR